MKLGLSSDHSLPVHLHLKQDGLMGVIHGKEEKRMSMNEWFNFTLCSVVIPEVHLTVREKIP